MSTQGDDVRGDEVLWTGAWLREARQRQGLAVKELARKAGVSASAITDVEFDRVASPGLVFMRKVANGLGVPLGALLGDTGGEEYRLGYQTAMIDVQDAIYNLRRTQGR